MVLTQHMLLSHVLGGNDVSIRKPYTVTYFVADVLMYITLQSTGLHMTM